LNLTPFFFAVSFEVYHQGNVDHFKGGANLKTTWEENGKAIVGEASQMLALCDKGAHDIVEELEPHKHITYVTTSTYYSQEMQGQDPETSSVKSGIFFWLFF
jgi:hypothetical protein